MAEPDRMERERRLKIRCWRRGTKEMDLILGGFFDRCREQLPLEDLARLEALIEEDDDALYRWISGAAPTPEAHSAIIARIRANQR